jgi:hypothetical protein
MPTLTVGPQSQHTRPNCPAQLNQFRLIIRLVIAAPGQRRGRSGPAPCRPKTVMRSPIDVRDGNFSEVGQSNRQVHFLQNLTGNFRPFKAPHEKTFAAAEKSNVL